MESMVRGALALFRGLDDGEAPEPVDVNALLLEIARGVRRMGGAVTMVAARSGRSPASRRRSSAASPTSWPMPSNSAAARTCSSRTERSWRSASATRARASRRRSWSGCSSRSIAWNPHATAIAAARGSGSASRAMSRRRTVAPSPSGTVRRRAGGAAGAAARARRGREVARTCIRPATLAHDCSRRCGPLRLGWGPRAGLITGPARRRMRSAC